MMKTYDETVAAIHALPRLAKTGGHERILALLHALGDPQHDRYVHVTGTNGKGSTASGIARIFEASGSRSDCTPRRSSCGLTSAS